MIIFFVPPVHYELLIKLHFPSDGERERASDGKKNSSGHAPSERMVGVENGDMYSEAAGKMFT